MALSINAKAAPLTPSAVEILQAGREGAQIARAYRGYPLQGYTIYAVKDARNLDPRDGSVDAVMLATPLERTRHAAFVAEFTGGTISPKAIRAAADLPDRWIEFLVFAHGRDSDDRTFPQQFGEAQLQVGDRTIPAADIRRSEPVEDTYPFATNDKDRFVATIGYRFDLSLITSAKLDGRVRFVDSNGKLFDLAFDLAALR